MSSRSRKARAKPVPVTPAADDVTTLDSYQPDYGARCEVCGGSPCVTGISKGRAVYQSGMCGVCTFGTSTAIDPENW
ncbi:hypothetical protein [Paraburkholderia youngii]|uniref:hypothetical protein n=1 Tax=Paraburkholderia youngii TaxID=2782701 RepID=UPI003D2100C5